MKRNFVDVTSNKVSVGKLAAGAGINSYFTLTWLLLKSRPVISNSYLQSSGLSCSGCFEVLDVAAAVLQGGVGHQQQPPLHGWTRPHCWLHSRGTQSGDTVGLHSRGTESCPRHTGNHGPAAGAALSK